QRVYFISTKGNLLGKKPKTLVYRRQPETVRGPHGESIPTSRIVWEPAQVELSIEAALAATKQPPKTAKLDNWLREQLKDGPLAVTEIIERGRKSGHTKHQLDYAKDRLGIVPKKRGLMGGWNWSLPE